MFIHDYSVLHRAHLQLGTTIKQAEGIVAQSGASSLAHRRYASLSVSGVEQHAALPLTPLTPRAQ